MQAIELTQDHKSKLLEMCKNLFPEMDAHTIEDTEESNGMILGSWGQSTNGIAIHWFEFVMTYLVNKLSELSNTWEEIPQYVSNIFPNNGANGKWNLYSKFHFTYPKNIYILHPVDYLYNEFKKLKL